jgi:hypothetical protein
VARPHQWVRVIKRAKTARKCKKCPTDRPPCSRLAAWRQGGRSKTRKKTRMPMARPQTEAGCGDRVGSLSVGMLVLSSAGWQGDGQSAPVSRSRGRADSAGGCPGAAVRIRSRATLARLPPWLDPLLHAPMRNLKVERRIARRVPPNVGGTEQRYALSGQQLVLSVY